MIPPCPFCGSSDIECYMPEEYIDDEGDGWVAYCLDCGVEARNEQNHRMTKEEAMAWWSRRAPPTPDTPLSTPIKS
jgi:hypothetical protein